MANEVIVKESVLREFTKDLFMHKGLPDYCAEMVADNLVEADLRGVSSHGVNRCKLYCNRMDAGRMISQDLVEVVKDEGATAIIDGHHFFGAVNGTKAMKLAISKAKQFGIGMVGVRHSMHFGTCAYYAEMATSEGMIGFVGSNTIPFLPPMGGLERKVGNNPIAFGIPAKTHYPIIIDMATSQVAMGKINLKAQLDQPIPLGWATDRAGQPTTDAKAAQQGFLLPMGGPKGLGLAIVLDLLSGALTGSGFGAGVNNPNTHPDTYFNCGHFFIAIDPQFFGGRDDFTEKVDGYIDYFKDCKKAEGVTEIFMPGEMEFVAREKNLEEGISLPAAVVSDLKVLAETAGVEWKKYFN